MAIVCALFILPLRAVNPEGDFRDSLVPPIVIDAREWKMAQLGSDPARDRIDAIVLGSSRSMLVGAPQLDQRYGVHAYNLAVDNAHAEDYLALYRWAKQHGIRPRYIFLGLDVEALNDDDVQAETFERSPELQGALDERPGAARTLDALRSELGKYKRMLTTWYISDAYRSIQLRFAAHPPPPNESFDDVGVLTYVRWDAERAGGTFSLADEIAKCIPLYLERFWNMHGLSPRRSEMLDRLFAEASDDGARIVAWVTPIHPQTASRLSTETAYARVAPAVGELLSALGDKYHADVRDFSDAASFGATPDGWYDCAHLDASNVARMVAELPR